MHRPRPTLESVALHAGVSRATVSRVVNGSTRVAEDSRAAVLRAIEELGYVPNQAARSLVTQRTDSFALVLPEEPGRVFSDDEFFQGVVRGVGQELEEADKQLVLMMARSPAGRDRVERFALARHVDGVMVASMHGADPLPAALARMGIPVVCNERLLGAAALPYVLPYVGVDNAGGAALAVRQLLRSGRTRVATVAGPQDMVAGIDRLTGYRTALKEAGREPVVAAGDFTQESGAVAMRELLAREPELDAVFVASDLMGLGVLRALRQAGRRVPEDVAVVGFDDVQAARYADPPLTTVRQPIAEIGRRLARQLLRLAGGEAIEPAVVLDVELVLRGSA
ncbi:LacI family DNA-binding transcriptional regulator [Streptomyces sp. NPDC059850]|uniref:LacI family DNA-binding transcriptional regulator n=1 Tax=Streptomyces sp. NPDC059850 TaxID=3346970 RepID=UPI0036630B0F